jgi:hypothetical protein
MNQHVIRIKNFHDLYSDSIYYQLKHLRYVVQHEQQSYDQAKQKQKQKNQQKTNSTYQEKKSKFISKQTIVHIVRELLVAMLLEFTFFFLFCFICAVATLNKSVIIESTSRP